MGAGAFASFGKNTTLRLPFQTYGQHRISIGSKCHIGPSSWFQVVGEAATQEGEPVLKIGDRVSTTGNLMITSASSVTIEDDVLMGRFVHISDHTHNYKDGTLSIAAQGITDPKPVTIKKGAWLAQGAVICPGVTIGENAVIAAYAVVKSDIPARCVAAGNPASVVKQLDS